MRNGRELGSRPAGDARKQSSPDHQGKAVKLGREEHSCPEQRLRDVFGAAVLA